MYAAGVWDHAKADMFFGIVSGFKNGSGWASNLHCVCMETHLQPTVAANQTGYNWLRRNFDRYAAIGVEVHLNALTISIDGFEASWSNAQKFEAQATWYRMFLQACVDSPACVDFEPFGLTDKYDMGTEPIYSLPFDTNYAPKPAFWAMVDVLENKSAAPKSGAAASSSISLQVSAPATLLSHAQMQGSVLPTTESTTYFLLTSDWLRIEILRCFDWCSN